MASGLVVASGLAPRWAAQQPHSRRRRYFRHTEPAGFGAASPPSAGQARSPQGRGQPVRIFWTLRSGRRQHYRTFVARRLLVASGLAPRWAAQQPHSRRRRYFRHTEPAGFGAASPPSAGQARSPQGRGQPVRIFWTLRSGRRQHYRTFVARRLLVASGLAPRWAAQQPHSRRRRYFRHTEPAGFGAASPPSAGQARSPQGRGAAGQDFLETSQRAAGVLKDFCGPQTSCGERACPALGCAAAPLQTP
ncbi:hypothetical protein SAMN04490200_5021 [Pseudomonas proteolytica]|nr:hypothetical protein SAMN04490200_5021 [Pseudomonas proteolytica]